MTCRAWQQMGLGCGSMLMTCEPGQSDVTHTQGGTSVHTQICTALLHASSHAPRV